MRLLIPWKCDVKNLLFAVVPTESKNSYRLQNYDNICKSLQNSASKSTSNMLFYRYLPKKFRLRSIVRVVARYKKQTAGMRCRAVCCRIM